MDKRIKKQFSQLYDKNIQGIYRFIFFKVNSEELAQDLTSDVFMKAWEVFQRENNLIDNKRAFIYRIARNLVIDYYRIKDRTRTLPIEDIPLSERGKSLEESVLINSDMEMVKRKLLSINDNYRSVLSLYYIEELSIKEVSKIIKKSEGATRVLLHRAINSLKEKIREG